MAEAINHDIKDIRKAVKALNASQLATTDTIKIVKATPDSLIKSFVNGVESIPKDKLDQLPNEVADFYNLVTGNKGGENLQAEGGEQKMTEDTQAATEDDKDKKPECFKKAWDADAQECKQCLEGYPEDYEACKVAVQAAKKQVPKKTPKKAAPKKEPVPRDKFGFRVGGKGNEFGKLLLAGGVNGISMQDVRRAKWNPTGTTYYEAFNRLAAKGMAQKAGQKLFVSEEFGGPSAAAVAKMVAEDEAKKKEVAAAAAAAKKKKEDEAKAKVKEAA